MWAALAIGGISWRSSNSQEIPSPSAANGTWPGPRWPELPQRWREAIPARCLTCGFRHFEYDVFASVVEVGIP